MARTRWAVLVLLGLAACARPSPSEIVLARVNGESITVARLEETFTARHRGHGILLAGSGAVREFLQTTINQALLVQEARRLGLQDDPAIQAARERLRGRRAAEAFSHDRVTKRVEVAEEEVQAVHARLGERFSARHLLVGAREDAARALERIRAGEPFGEVAREMSLAATAGRGGDLGIVLWGRLDPALEERLWALQKGETSEPFETDDGWNLLSVTDRRSVEPPKLEQVQGRIKATLADRKARQRSGALLRELMAKHGVTIDVEPVLVALKSGDGGKTPMPSRVVAEAAGERITLDRALGLIDARVAGRLSPDRLRRQVRFLLEGQLFQALLEKEGLARGYGDRPEVVQAVEKMTDRAILERLLDGVVLARVEVGETEIEAYYRSHPKEFTEPEALRLSAIVVDDEEDAREIVAALGAGESFPALARRRSKDPALIATGGELRDWVTRGQLDPAVDAVAFSLSEGQVGVAKGRAGHFVVRVDRRREERLLPLADVKERARERALRQRSRDTVTAWTAKLRTASTIEVDDEAIQRAVAAYEAQAREKAAARDQRGKRP
jgi:peptidyl-prolyl cis-trans isomerase C